jgi:hypothetical protein
MTQQRKSQKAHELMGRAKAALILEQPFFASLICSMPLIEDTNGDILQIPTMGTDGKTVWYNPEFTEKLSPDEVKFVLCHEVMHSVYAHMYRRGSRDPRRWNMAGDYVINDMRREDWPDAGRRVDELAAGGGRQRHHRGRLRPAAGERWRRWRRRRQAVGHLHGRWRVGGRSVCG